MYDQKSPGLIRDVLHHTSVLCSYDTLVRGFINFIHIHVPTYQYVHVYDALFIFTGSIFHEESFGSI